MALPLARRGFNPVWSMVDLVGNQLDDTYYLFVLENTLPYIPATIWHDPNKNIPWEDPIQFLANGTLPLDMYWDCEAVYRLEVRQGNTQSDPLVYLVENYTPCCEGEGPDNDTSAVSDNQITNPQFSLISFSSPYSRSITGPASVQVAPGWFIDVTGSGTLSLQQVPLNASAATLNPSNAPYALLVTNSGFASIQLRQRFQQNGMLWANKTVACAITARSDSAGITVRGILQDSASTFLGEVLEPTTLSSTFQEYTGHATLPDTTNTDVPPDAYIDFILTMPANSSNVYLTSFQLVVQDELNISEPSFIQDSIERQVDHTFHYYRNSLLLMPKDTILTGWEFALNPFQFETTTVTSTTAKCQYICDQTIIYTTGAAGAVDTGLSSAPSAVRQNLTVQANATASNQFALIQYIDPATIRQYWSYRVSALVRCKRFNDEGSSLGLKMRLIYRTSLPPTIGNTEPIASWGGPGTDPVFSAGWTAIIPENDPVYEIRDDYNVLVGPRAFFAYPFENMQLPLDTTDDMTLGIVVYTTNNMDNDPTIDESVAFDSISLVPNEFAIDTNPKTYDQVLRECEYYYETSYGRHVLPATAAAVGARMAVQLTAGAGSVSVIPRTFGLEYRTIKRENSPTVHLYAAATGTIDNVSSTGVNGASTALSVVDYPMTNYVQTSLGSKNVYYVRNTLNAGGFLAALPDNPDGYIAFHYTVDARLGR